MRKILYATLAVFGLMACDNITKEDRLIYEPMPEMNRSVLIEDFTGQRCVNCPNAADEIHSLQQEYGEETIIAVGIHGGPLAVHPNPEKGIVGLATETGDKYNDYWKVEQWPMGMVNRSGVCAYTDWKTKVREELQKKAPVNIFIFNDLPDNDGQTHVMANIECVKGNITGKFHVWVVEDNIKAIQLMPDGTANQEYIHQHVFRAAVNGEWGEDINMKKGQTVSTTAVFTVPADWNQENLSLVAFVYNSQGVQQVIRSPFTYHDLNY